MRYALRACGIQQVGALLIDGASFAFPNGVNNAYDYEWMPKKIDRYASTNAYVVANGSAFANPELGVPNTIPWHKFFDWYWNVKEWTYSYAYSFTITDTNEIFTPPDPDDLITEEVTTSCSGSGTFSSDAATEHDLRDGNGGFGFSKSDDQTIVFVDTFRDGHTDTGTSTDSFGGFVFSLMGTTAGLAIPGAGNVYYPVSLSITLGAEAPLTVSNIQEGGTNAGFNATVNDIDQPIYCPDLFGYPYSNNVYDPVTGDLLMIQTFTLTVNSASCVITPSPYWEYRKDDASNPIFNGASGSQIITPAPVDLG